MHLDDNQIQFLEKRKKLLRLWPVAGSLLLVLLLVLVVWIYIRSPLLINPFEVIERLDAGTIEQSTLLLAATLLPVVMLTCIVIMIVMVLFAFAVIATEKKHIQLIEKLLEGLRE